MTKTKHPHSRQDRRQLEQLDEKKKNKAERPGKVRRKLAIDYARALEDEKELRDAYNQGNHLTQ